jgi:hypothetical protein
MRIWLTLIFTFGWYCTFNKGYSEIVSMPLMLQLDLIPTNHFFACLIVFAFIYPIVKEFFNFLDRRSDSKSKGEDTFPKTIWGAKDPK